MIHFFDSCLLRPPSRRHSSYDINSSYDKKKTVVTQIQTRFQAKLKLSLKHDNSFFPSAVREDRQRGGRSSYDGANNYARGGGSRGSSSQGQTPPRSRVVVKRPTPTQVKRTIMVPTEQGNQIITMVYPDGSQADVSVSHVSGQWVLSLYLSLYNLK